jgi:hypothetical protein
MSIADEILELKKLLDSGILSKDEFERAKLGLLKGISVTTNPTFRQDDIVGKWRIVGDGSTWDYELSLSGDAKLVMSGDIISEAKKSFIYGTVLGISEAYGKWWLDKSQLVIAVTLGNAIGRFWASSTDKDPIITSAYDLLEVTQQEIRCINVKHQMEATFFGIGLQQ